MENRFGVKDLFLFALLIVLIVVILLSMKQADRQFEVLTQIKTQGEEQTKELADLHREIVAGQFSRPAPVTTTAPAAVADTTTFEDPFARVKAAQKMPGYALGDWYITAIANTDKITPLVSGDVYAAEVQGRVLESLVQRDPVTLDWQPLLAQSWKISDDGLTFTFEIRQGVTFSDGVPMTADDVVFTFNWIMDPKVEAPRERAYYEKIDSVKQNGDYEVVFHFKEPYFDAMGLAGGINVLPRHFYEKYSPDDFNKSTGLLLGTGPYRMQDPTNWAPGQPLELLRNERYWGEPAPFDKLIYRIIDNDLAKLTTFRNGEIDRFDPSAEQYNKMVDDTDLVARTQHYDFDTPTGGYVYIAWNEKRAGKPTRFADKRVRQAMTMLTDKKRICQDILLNYATPATGPFSRLGKQYNPDVKPWPFDVDRAISLLKDAGFRTGADGVLVGPDGEPFRFKLTYPTGRVTYERIALFLKDTYARAGITLDPDPLDWSVFADRLKNRDFDAISLGWSAGIEDDIYQMFDSSQIAGEGDNFMSYSNPELDKLIEQARKTVDEKKRLPMWKECHLILHDDQPYTFLFTRKELVFLDKRIQNVQQIPLGLNDLVEWYVPKPLQKWEK